MFGKEEFCDAVDYSFLHRQEIPATLKTLNCAVRFVRPIDRVFTAGQRSVFGISAPRITLTFYNEAWPTRTLEASAPYVSSTGSFARVTISVAHFIS